jgi:hypothetical protein
MFEQLDDEIAMKRAIRAARVDNKKQPFHLGTESNASSQSEKLKQKSTL